MSVVSNTWPLSNLAIIGRLGLLRERYGSVLIPAAVHGELAVVSHPAAKARIEAALREGWLKVESLPTDASLLPLPHELDPGEAEATRLCQHLPADKVILDDALGRAAVRHLGLKFTDSSVN